MPSGAKKRKAAKKKKEKGTNNPQGDNELKSQSQDEKGSDGGEGGSPAYGDGEHAFSERNEEVVESDLSAAVAKPLEEAPSDVKIDDEARGGQGLVAEESCESKGISVDNIESGKESDYGNGNSGGGSHDEIFTFTAKNSKDEPYNSVKQTVAFDELVKSIDSSHTKMTLITQNAQVEETVNSVVESSADSVKAMTSASVVKSGSGNDLVEKSVGSQVGENDLVAKESDYGNGNSGGGSHDETFTFTAKNSKDEKTVGSQIGETDLAGKSKEDKVYPFSDENARASSWEESRQKKIDYKVSASVPHSCIPESTNGAEHVKDSEPPECSENQPLVASAPQTAQKTSWLSCCGVFEALLGSGR